MIKTLQGKYANKLQQENKQLKNILTELEEWLETFDKKYLERVALCNVSGTIQKVQDKIQELKEKYK